MNFLNYLKFSFLGIVCFLQIYFSLCFSSQMPDNSWFLLLFKGVLKRCLKSSMVFTLWVSWLNYHVTELLTSSLLGWEILWRRIIYSPLWKVFKLDDLCYGSPAQGEGLISLYLIHRHSFNLMFSVLYILLSTLADVSWSRNPVYSYQRVS